MIDLQEHHEAQIVRQCGSQANIIETLHRELEMYMRQGDEFAVTCAAVLIEAAARRIAQAAAHKARGE